MVPITVTTRGGWLRAGHHWMIVWPGSADTIAARPYHSGAPGVAVPVGHRPYLRVVGRSGRRRRRLLRRQPRRRALGQRPIPPQPGRRAPGVVLQLIVVRP